MSYYKKLNVLRNRHKHDDMRFRTVHKKFIPVLARLTVQLVKNKEFKNTTYSSKCWMHQIDGILSKYRDRRGRSLVAKYQYNGRTYSPDERPVWINAC